MDPSTKIIVLKSKIEPALFWLSRYCLMYLIRNYLRSDESPLLILPDNLDSWNPSHLRANSELSHFLGQFTSWRPSRGVCILNFLLIGRNVSFAPGNHTVTRILVESLILDPQNPHRLTSQGPFQLEMGEKSRNNYPVNLH